jgi:hypothetical protein
LKSIFDAAFAEHLRGFMAARLPVWRGKEEVYMKITVFKAAGDTFALSERPNGSNLPTELGPWTPASVVEIKPGEEGQMGFNTADALKDIREQGFHVFKAKDFVQRSRSKT